MNKITDAEATAWLLKSLKMTQKPEEKEDKMIVSLGNLMTEIENAKKDAMKTRRLSVASNIACGFLGNMGVRLHDEEELQTVIQVAVPAFVKIADALIAEVEKGENGND